MNFLPIVARELRVAARKRSTFWLRVAAAGTGLLLGLACLVLNQYQGVRTADIGRSLFAILTWTCMAAALLAGLFFTSDCLSEEKREGTLGLLFLTELRGYDVAIGKLLATSLRGSYALLAVLPIIALTQLMGGVTGAQYWQSSIALANALLFSLAAGMLVSAVSRDSQKALAGSFLSLLLIVVGSLVLDLLLAHARKRGFQPFCSRVSPAYVLVAAGAWGRLPYWSALAITNGLAWSMLGLACLLVPHTWQERRRWGSGSSRDWSYAWKYGSARRRLRLRQKLLAKLPLAWLVCRERWQSRALWGLVFLVGGVVVFGVAKKLPPGSWIFWNYLGGLFTLMVYLCAASQACRFLAESRRSGFLELLLVTPVSERQIVRGQWQGLVRMFGLPLALLLGVQVTAATLSQRAFHRLAAQVPAASAGAAATNSLAGSNTVTLGPNGALGGSNVTVTSSVVITVNGKTVTGGPSSPSPGSLTYETLMATGAALASALTISGNLLALVWFGMWMGMTSRTANLATLKTLLFVQVIPWFVIAFGTSIAASYLLAHLFMTLASNQPGMWLSWWPLLSAVLMAVASIAKDIGFIVWSRNRLYRAFRQQATRNVGQSQFTAPLPSIPIPPLLPTAT